LIPKRNELQVQSQKSINHDEEQHMKPVVFLRIASVLTLIHAALHTVGGVFGKPPDASAAATWATMQANTFPVMGAVRSYAEFLRGMGLAVTIFLTLESIVLWQLGSLSRAGASRLRPILATFLVGYLVLAVNSYKYFFSGPVITEILIAACLGMAIATARTAPAAIPSTLAASRI
jgi:hypothetical protein